MGIFGPRNARKDTKREEVRGAARGCLTHEGTKKTEGVCPGYCGSLRWSAGVLRSFRVFGVFRGEPIDGDFRTTKCTKGHESGGGAGFRGNGPSGWGGSGEEIADDLGVFDAGEALVEALVLEDEAAVINAEAVEEGGVEVVHVHRVFHDVVAEVIGLAVDGAGADATAGEPHGEVPGMMIAPVGFGGEFALGIDGAPEFAAPDDEGGIEETALFEVGDQGGAGLIGVEALIADGGGEVVVLVPSAMEDLNDADTAFDEASGEDGGVGETAGAFHVGPVHFEGGIGFTGEIGEFGHAGLHAERHLVLGDPGLDFGITEGAMMPVVQFIEGIEHVTSVGGQDAGRVLEVEDGIAGAAEGDAGVAGGEEAGTPHAGEEGLTIAGGGEGGGEDDEGGEIIAFAAEAIGEPGADGGFAGDFTAGHDEGAGGVMIDGIGEDGTDYGDVVDDAGGVGEDFTDPGATAAVLMEGEAGGGDGEAFLTAGHGAQPLVHADGVGKVLVEVVLEPGFVVPEIDLGRGSVHVEIDDGFGLGGEVGEAGEWRVDGATDGAGRVGEEPASGG